MYIEKKELEDLLESLENDELHAKTQVLYQKICQAVQELDKIYQDKRDARVEEKLRQAEEKFCQHQKTVEKLTCRKD